MILTEEEAKKRLNHPMNLMNRMKVPDKNKDAMSIFGLGKNGSIRKDETQRTREDFNSQPSLGVAIPDLTATALIIPTFNPFEKTESSKPTLDSLLDNSDNQIKLTLAHNNALETLNDAVARMRLTIDEIKPDRLPAVVASASKVVESIRRERMELRKNSDGKEVHYHFYTPVQRKIETYDVIEVQ